MVVVVVVGGRVVVVAGSVREENSGDREEQAQIRHMHDLMEQHDLDGQVRWLGVRLDKTLTGEIYRVVADKRGAFAQPALFEAFGLTVIEAMSTGLPTFATCFGGPLEIIEDGVSGFHIDPTRGAESAARMAAFFKKCRKHPEHWDEISRGALERIEARYGFNRTTLATFVIDRLKGAILGLLLGVPLIGGILYFFETSGGHAWWYAWLTVIFFMLVIQYIAPTWIMPLFNKFTPLEPGELKSAILSYADSINFSIDNVYVMDGSRRSSKSNAFFTGFGKHRRIVLFDTLIKRHTTGELLAVLAHEMGHYKKKHILQTMVLGILQMGIMLYLLSIFISYQRLFDAFFMPQKSVYAGLIFFAMLYSPLDFFICMCMQIL